MIPFSQTQRQSTKILSLTLVVISIIFAKMQNFSDDNVSPIKVVDFGCIPVDTVAEKIIVVENSSEVSPFAVSNNKGSNKLV